MRRRNLFGQGANRAARVEILRQIKHFAFQHVDLPRLIRDDLAQILDGAFVFGGKAFQRDKTFLDFEIVHGRSPLCDNVDIPRFRC